MTKVNKPWGMEEIWAQTDKYVGKILYIKSGESLSRQYHRYKTETLRVLRGPVVIEIGSGAEILIITALEGTVIHIPPGFIHRMHNPLNSFLPFVAEILEVSTTELEDVVRLEDSYGRVESEDEGNRLEPKS